MENDELLKMVEEKAKQWLAPIYDDETRKEVRRMLENSDKTELIDSFYKDLEFGTGGLRGIMGAGTNRMNIYTVGAATQGLSNYLKRNFVDLPEIRVAIGHDCRNNSRLFAESSAGIFAANGIKALLFEDLRPTPEMSFAIREYGCQSGIIITASHNPKEYNGYKVYDNTGCQILYPADEEIVKYYNNIYEIEKCRIEEYERLLNSRNIQFIDDSLVDDFVESSINYDNNKKNYSFSNLKVAFTSVHGTGITPFKKIASRLNFEVFYPEKQILQDENFPTVKSPDPENKECLKEVIDKGIKNNADIIIATDPDADRVRFGFRNS
ncbi:MAG TPA: phospho-sugar mutase, partial [Prolixibacteraceae bacterium]|nr:phospho-sugar mutase [Prolixibacteraceae bacterium]